MILRRTQYSVQPKNNPGRMKGTKFESEGFEAFKKNDEYSMKYICSHNRENRCFTKWFFCLKTQKDPLWTGDWYNYL